MTHVVIHVHGYGGDLLSNKFVRLCHDFWPSLGKGFLSIQLPTSHYIFEQYSDSGVEYCGSSMVLPERTVRTVTSVVQTMSEAGYRVALQGHSFGTNVVKSISDDIASLLEFCVYLSPADSVELQSLYEKPRTGPLNLSMSANDADNNPVIVWDVFGITAGNRTYQIPIERGVFSRLVDSREFNAWSSVENWHPRIPTLVLVAAGDPIPHVAGFSKKLQKILQSRDSEKLHFVAVESGSHSFADAHDRLFATLEDWARSL